MTPSLRLIFLALGVLLLNSGCSSPRQSVRDDVQRAERSSDGRAAIKSFAIAPLADGKYTPWRAPEERDAWYAGEIIILNGSTFHYARFSDVSSGQRDYSGRVNAYQNHIYLDHPSIPYPYRIAGTADGKPVLLTWEGYEQWKKTGKVAENDILYRQNMEALNGRKAFTP